MSPYTDTKLNSLVKVSTHKLKQTASQSNQRFIARPADSNTQQS